MQAGDAESRHVSHTVNHFIHFVMSARLWVLWVHNNYPEKENVSQSSCIPLQFV